MSIASQEKRRQRTREYTWFIHSLDSFTNQVIAERLEQEDFFDGLLCDDGRRRPLWRVTRFEFISVLRRSNRQLSLKFEVFVREGEGQVRKFIAQKKYNRLT